MYESDLEALGVLLTSAVSEQSCPGIHARNAHGWTALHAAAYMNRIDALRVLLSFTVGDEVLSEQTELGHSALHLACTKGHTEAVKMILKRLVP